ncbi:MAG: hypothetical protein WBN31_11585 [Gammaproteobacteria bacterium]
MAIGRCLHWQNSTTVWQAVIDDGKRHARWVRQVRTLSNDIAR